MKKNVGGLDRAFRALLGVGVIGAGWYYGSWWGALGVIPLMTAVFQWCPVYVPFGTTTCTETRMQSVGGSPR